MKDLLPDYLQNPENLDDSEKLDNALFEMEMLYKSRCVKVPLTTNVKVVDIEEEEK